MKTIFCNYLCARTEVTLGAVTINNIYNNVYSNQKNGDIGCT